MISSDGLNFDDIYSRWKTDSAKWDLQTKRFPGQKIHAAMGIADLDFKTAPEITKAIESRILHENWGYILTPDSYYESIINWLQNRYGEKIERGGFSNTFTGINPEFIFSFIVFQLIGALAAMLFMNFIQSD